MRKVSEALREHGVRDEHGSMRRRTFLIATTATLAAACAPAPKAVASTSPAARDRPNDPDAGNPQSGVWPAFMLGMNAQVKDAYLYAATHPEILEYIPCYCGCGSATHNGGHSDNERCYVVERFSSGWMILEPHGSQCGVCVGITLDTRAMLGRGLPLREVRAQIDRKWSGAGPGTPTKLPL